MAETRRIEFVDTSLRDGNQSLWSATGLRTADVLEVAPAIDRVGYHAVDFTASTHIAVSVRYHQEDPWRRMRLAAAAMPRTPLTFLTTGGRFISWAPAAEDVLELVFRTVLRNGMRRVQIAEPSNDPARIAAVAALAKRAGAEEVVAALVYSLSPVHTDEYFAARIEPLAAAGGVDRVYLKDPGGLLTPERAATLVPMVIAGSAGKPVEVHTHCTTGLAEPVYLEAARCGAAAVHTAVGPLAEGTSQPAADRVAAEMEEAGIEHGLDLGELAESARLLAAIAAREGLPAGEPQEHDPARYRHQLPGGMVSTMRRQLEEMGKPELYDAALVEIEQVRAELGYPIMVTPLSQFVASQAVMNVASGERYARPSDQVIRYLLGQFGAPPAPPDPAVADRVLSQPRAEKLRRVEPLSLEGAREKHGTGISDEELLLRLTMPAGQVDAMLAAEAGHGEEVRGAAG